MRIAVCLLILGVPEGLRHGTAAAQDESVEWRLEHVAGVKPQAMRAFLTALQQNVRSGNRRAVCASFDYPFRWSEGYIRAAAECRERYTQIVDKGVMQAIAAQRFDRLFVNSGGIMIGSGEVWLSGICRDVNCLRTDIRVITVNNADDRTPPNGRPLFMCRTNTHRIEVSPDGRGGSRYREWLRSRPASARPDLEITRGTRSTQGSPGCSFNTWSFTKGPDTYAVSELGCFPDSSKPPKGAIGQVEVNTGTASAKTSWCY